MINELLIICLAGISEIAPHTLHKVYLHCGIIIQRIVTIHGVPSVQLSSFRGCLWV